MKRLSTISMIIFKILLIVVLGVTILFALVSFWGKLNYTKAKEARTTNINFEAEDIYSYLSKYYKDHDSISDGNYTVQGEYNNTLCIMYPNTLSSESKIIYGQENNYRKRYWVGIIKNGRVDEIWASHYPIDTSRVHEYTYEEQDRNVHFVSLFELAKWEEYGWIDDSDLVGYYKVPADHYSNPTN